MPSVSSPTVEDGHKKERSMSSRHPSHHRYGSSNPAQEPQVNGVMPKLPSHRRPSRDHSRHLTNGVHRSYDGSSKSSTGSKVDYSLYLVADATPRILGDRDIIRVVDSALRGGVTVVQYRDKFHDTTDLVAKASALHEVTQKHGVPLIINDRLDVAIAMGAEGVHLGQDDMDIQTARQMLGNDRIIGATVSSPEEARKALRDGADYLGIGTVFGTATKEDAKSIIGTAGLRTILSSLPSPIPTVCIGGINAGNAQRILHQSSIPSQSRHLNGIAVVSAIMSSPDPSGSATHLRSLVDNPPNFAPFALTTSSLYQGFSRLTLSEIKANIPALLARLAHSKPLCHNMTNLVVTNFAANVALALGGSPIMSSNGSEAGDLAARQGSLVLNMGTVTHDALSSYKTALSEYNAVGAPVLLDPVGGGATSVRAKAVRDLLANGFFDIVKGNEAEIRTLLNEGRGPFVSTSSHEFFVQHGVDGGDAGLSEKEKKRLVRDLAARERNVALMTGETDYISDGRRVFAVRNGHEYLGCVTGSGCTLGTTVAAFAAIVRQAELEDLLDPRSGDLERSKIVEGGMLMAVLAGTLVFEIAAELAVETGRVFGPGSFVPAFLDSVYHLRETAKAGDGKWIEISRVEEVEV